MSRLYPGKYRLLVRFHWPDGSPGFDYTHTPDEYDECAKLAIVLGGGVPWQVVDPASGKVQNVRAEASLIVGPVVE